MSLLPHRAHEDRPWGSFERFTLNELSTVKVIGVKAGEELSLQQHAHRAEFWYILSGEGTVTISGMPMPASTGKEFEIPVAAPHRIKANDAGMLWFLEIALGEFDEHDEVRLADDYGREDAAPQ